MKKYLILVTIALTGCSTPSIEQYMVAKEQCAKLDMSVRPTNIGLCCSVATRAECAAYPKY